MSEDVYHRLARYLDNLPAGFPGTTTGVELRILRRLFTPEEAELAIHLRMALEKAEVISRRAGVLPEEGVRRLKEMSEKGLVFRVQRQGGPVLYMAAQFMVGIWEYQVSTLYPGLIRDVNEYMPTFFRFDLWNKAPQFRTVPVGKSINTRLEIVSHEKAEELIDAQKMFLVAPCICRRKQRILGQGCSKPEETCLAFGVTAIYYERNGLGRVIDKYEALQIVGHADKAGLVLQPSNTKNIGIMCSCCGCCCLVLTNLKRHPRPASMVSSPFIANAHAETCKGCGVCVKRCQMDALRIEEEKAILDLDRCIGCGLCVSTCPTASLSLVRKPESEQREVPRDAIDGIARLGKGRGKSEAVTRVQAIQDPG
jgi:Pyruvate/2-oxoacid:ferredoxin oxidoreductase delta subunit